LSKLFDAFKQFDDEGKTYKHISFSTKFDDIMESVGDEQDVSSPFNATFDTIYLATQAVIYAMIACIAVNAAESLAAIAAAALAALEQSTEDALYLVDIAGGEVAAAAATESAASKLSRLVGSAPFSIARVLVIVIIVAITIATLVINIQLQKLIEKYSNSFKN
jgi:hypothetical protein